MNVLLHVPSDEFQEILRSINEILNDDGIFFMGVYGGETKEEIITDHSRMGLPRFFSFHSDEDMKEAVSRYFEIIKFERIQLEEVKENFHFQALTLRKKIDD